MVESSRGIWVDSVGRCFGHRWALRDVSFTVRPGEWVLVVGPNEAGKSTLIRILSTLVLPNRGKATVCGYDVVRQPRQVRRCIGVMLDTDRAFYYRLTAFQNLEFFGGLYGLRGRTLRRRVAEVLDQVGLSHACHVRFMKFSAGMRKRLAFARALLVDPPVFLLDEPTAHLDPEHSSVVLDILADLRARGRTILTTAHTADEVDLRADRVLHLEEGCLVAEG